MFNTNYPVVVAICGDPGSGKTTTANKICPSAFTYTENDLIIWDHYTNASPLYELAYIRQDITGVDKKNRQLYAIEDVVRNLFRNTLPFDDMIELVYDIYSEPIAMNEKPRSFLQNVGSYCRRKDADCFPKFIKSKIKNRFALHLKEFDETEKIPYYGCIISDVRYTNEAEIFKALPNSLLIELTAPLEVVNERLMERDGFTFTPDQWAHESEQDRQKPEFRQHIDYTIDTSTLSIDEQVATVLDLIYDNIDIKESV